MMESGEGERRVSESLSGARFAVCCHLWWEREETCDSERERESGERGKQQGGTGYNIKGWQVKKKSHLYSSQRIGVTRWEFINSG